MAPTPAYVAVDLGAGSGRVLVGSVARDVFLEEVHRFSYQPRHSAGHLRWNFGLLLDGLLAGLGAAAPAAHARGAAIRSIGVDSWGVDYGLTDDEGVVVEEPICYRDDRTGEAMARVLSKVPRETIFRDSGIQLLPFNTLYQLAAHVREGLPARARRLLMIPDLCHQTLCGSAVGERTNASTTQLLDVRTGEWNDGLFAALDLPRALMPEIRDAGTRLGPLRGDLQRELGLAGADVVQPATHDTASAVAGTPLRPGWAFISSGTWSLVGVERNTPLLDRLALDANFTNERGVGGTFRFLKNVAGLWILECCRREWQAQGIDAGLQGLLDGAAAFERPAGLIYPDSPRFFNPPCMLDELRAALAETGQPSVSDPAELTKVVLDSLAFRYASVVDSLEIVTGERVSGIHIVGGGSCNDYLNQATANATGRPVLAGPVEATGLGNILMQAITDGAATIEGGRQRIAEAFQPRHFEPVDDSSWGSAGRHYEAIEQAAIS